VRLPGGTTAEPRTIVEVFVCDLPDEPADLEITGAAPLTGTSATRPAPPRGVAQRRLTFTAGRQHPGIQGPRHWLRSSPDGARIACLMRDDAGVVQLFTVSPNGGESEQITRTPWNISSAFTWSPDGSRIACVGDGRVQLVDADGGGIAPLTDAAAGPPRPEACVHSPDGRRIAFLRSVAGAGGTHNQIFVVDAPS
jgi:Tol biopolymer transport system component